MVIMALFNLRSTTDDVPVAFPVPCPRTDTSGAKNILAHPADDGFWQIVHDLDISRYTEVRHPVSAEVEQLGAVQRGLGTHRDKQQDVVLAQFTWHTDYCRLDHSRVAHDDALHFDRGDILAPPAQRIFDPVKISQIAVAVEHSKVPGSEPPRVPLDSQA